MKLPFQRELPRVGRLFKAVAAAILLAAVETSASAAVVIGGFTFEDDAFADVVLNATPDGSGFFGVETSPSSGLQVLNLPADLPLLEAAVTGSDLDRWISLRSSAAEFTVGFTDFIPFDGIGPDIAIMEIGATAPVTVTINEVTQQYVSQPSSTPGVNLVLIDLLHFGVTEASALSISSSSILNDIAAIGAINVTPVPEATTLCAWLLAALCFLPIVRRLRRADSAG